MYLESGNLVYSPSDITTFMASPFASWMERLVLEYPDRSPEPDPADELGGVLQQRGLQHEAHQFQQFLEQGFTVADLSEQALGSNSFHLRQQATLEAMRAGYGIIYQAALELSPFRGYVDFLVKVPGSSQLGDYHYEVWDTKLSLSVKPAAVVQLCCYTDMLTQFQHYQPTYLTVVTGSGKAKALKVEDYLYYYRSLRNRFLAQQQTFNPEQMPDPADSTSFGRWSQFAEHLLDEQDHLSRVANITRSQIKKLNQAGIHTCTALASTELPRIRGMQQTRFEYLKAQATLQLTSAGQIPPLYEILKPDNGQGLALLPPHDDADVFFDIEGFPLEEGGLEYLWGNTYFDEAGQRQFLDFWAHNPEQEKQAFQSFMQWAYQRWQVHPNMHIYHYASYEVTACKRLMGRYGVCEHEVDQLLRHGVFIDLYRIVKTGLMLGEPRYSIKNVEHLYRGKRDTAVGNGGDSVVVYERWREMPDGDTWESSQILHDIRDYNRDDCESTQELTAWLREQQAIHGIGWVAPTVPDNKEQQEGITELTRLRDQLLQRMEQEPLEQAALTEHLAWTLEFHRREAKPVWWRLFERKASTHDELLDDIDCLACCSLTDTPTFKPTPKARNLAYTYTVDAQEFKRPRASGGKDPKMILFDGTDTHDATWLAEHCDLNAGHIVIQLGKTVPSFMSLLPNEYVNPKPIPESIQSVVAAYAQGQGYPNAIMDFLQRRPPRLQGHTGSTIIPADEPNRLQAIIAAVSNLDNSYLVLQGPPGTGKTFTGKHIIAALVGQGKTVGITSNSHAAINNLLVGVASHCREEGIEAHCCCTSITGDDIAANGIHVIKNDQIVEHVHPSSVIGTTAWGFSREDAAGLFDYLFVDEAGQVSVANLIGVSRSCRNLVLMGDQMQLSQPSQGSHPQDSGNSVLDYLLKNNPVVPPDMGIFLDTTYRMHRTVNQFISDAIYAGQLQCHHSNNHQVIPVPAGYNGLLAQEAGVLFIPVEHEGNTQASEEEVDQIVALVNELLTRTFTDKSGQSRPIGWDDVLFVAPYNHQVNYLKQAMPQARVGSVDRFQGQEAPVVFFSLCTSDAAEAPRGIDFLYEKNRINVAISRAQALAIVVGNPALFSTPVNSLGQMEKVNVLARLEGYVNAV
jgi:uncharacterized protein